MKTTVASLVKLIATDPLPLAALRLMREMPLRLIVVGAIRGWVVP